MKIKCEIFAVVAIASIGTMFLAGCKTLSPAEIEGPQSTIGFNGPLKLVAKYKPLHLYIYADLASTNKHPDYVIFYRNEPLVISDNKSNAVEISLCEKNFQGDLRTIYNQNGQILKRVFSAINDNSTQTNYTYFDTNGDGQWDFLHISGTNSENSRLFVRSNLCWAPIIRK